MQHPIEVSSSTISLYNLVITVVPWGFNSGTTMKPKGFSVVFLLSILP